MPYSIIAKDDKFSHIGPAIQTLRVSLRSSPPEGQIDSDFHLFLQHLTEPRTVIFTDDAAKILFDREVLTLPMHTAVRGLFRLPTLVNIVIKAAGFPLATLSSCPHLRRLVLCSPTLGLPPNCDTWYDFRKDDPTENSAATKIRISELALFGDSEFSGGLATWLRDPKNGISSKEIRSATLQFHSDVPTQTGKTLFCNFRHLQHLRVHFKALKQGNWILPNLSVTIIPITDILSLIDLRSFQLDYSTTGQLYEDTGQNFVLLIIRFTIPLLLNLPHPNLLKILEIYMMTPTSSLSGPEWQKMPRGGKGFSPVWTNIDGIVESRFTGLERFAVYIPYLSHEEVLKAFRKCSQKGIMGRALTID